MAAIGVGVIGCGYWGPNLIRNFARHDDATMVSVCDMQLDRANKVAGWYGIPSVTDDPSALINNPDVSLVVVATPAGSHYSLAKAALEAVGGSTEDFARLVRANFEMYRKLVADLNIRVN